MNLVKKKLVNSVIKRLLMILLLPLIFIGCTEKKVQKFESEKFLFGTYVKITIYDKDEKLAKTGMEEAFNEIEKVLENKDREQKGIDLRRESKKLEEEKRNPWKKQSSNEKDKER